MRNFGIWLADSPFGGMLKAALGAVLVYVLDNVASFDLAPVVIDFPATLQTKIGNTVFVVDPDKLFPPAEVTSEAVIAVVVASYVSLT